MRKWLILSCLLFSSFHIFAQTPLTGKVTDIKTGTPLTGVSVRIKSGAKGTTTNADGIFKISVNSGDVLEITAVGYQPQSVSPDNKTDISIALAQITTELGEVVVTGNRGMAVSEQKVRFRWM